jgi:hypothetical protein
MLLVAATLLSLIPVYVLYRFADKPGKAYQMIYWLGGPILAFGAWNIIDFVLFLPDRIARGVDAGAGAAHFILGMLVALAVTIIVGLAGWIFRKYWLRKN